MDMPPQRDFNKGVAMWLIIAMALGLTTQEDRRLAQAYKDCMDEQARVLWKAPDPAEQIARAASALCGAHSAALLEFVANEAPPPNIRQIDEWRRSNIYLTESFIAGTERQVAAEIIKRRASRK